MPSQAGPETLRHQGQYSIKMKQEIGHLSRGRQCRCLNAQTQGRRFFVQRARIPETGRGAPEGLHRRSLVCPPTTPQSRNSHSRSVPALGPPLPVHQRPLVVRLVEVRLGAWCRSTHLATIGAKVASLVADTAAEQSSQTRLQTAVVALILLRRWWMVMRPGRRVIHRLLGITSALGRIALLLVSLRGGASVGLP